MSKNENDVTEGGSARESAATAMARRRAIEGDAPPSAEAIGAAVAKALERQREAPPPPAQRLPEIVRASVRCGYETNRRVASDGSTQLVTAPGSITFKPHETADGREHTIQHGRPVKLKRDAFERYQGDGKVIIAQ